MINLIQLDNESSIPKYKQLVKAIQQAVDERSIQQGDQLPSMNQICSAFGVARETVFKAYQELKSRGIISSSPGKGYFVSAAPGFNKRNIFLLLDNFTTYKEILFNSFTATLQDSVVDIYFHHFNPRVFHSLVQEAIGKYTDYVIMPLTSQEEKDWLQRTLDSNSVYILDTGFELYGEAYPSVCQNFENEIFSAFSTLAHLFAKYEKIVMVWGQAPEPFQNHIKDDVIAGLKKFCHQSNIPWELVAHADKVELQKGVCYFVSYDFDLVTIMQNMRQQNFSVGKDIGIISFNDAPLKAIVGENGITTFSTDFAEMGKSMAELIISKENKHIENPYKVIDRKSL